MMEKNISIKDVYVTLDSKNIDSVKEKAIREASESEYEEGTLAFPNATFEADEIYFDKSDKGLHISGNLFSNGVNIGYISPIIPLGDDTVLEVIDFYMKKLGKLKTVLEATKE